MTSERAEHLSSVHNNPFVRQFGLPHHSRSENDEMVPSSVPSSNSSERGDEDMEQEYGVNSGFVNKLRSKFAQLEHKSVRVGLSKKSASVENLLSLGSNEYSGSNSRSRFGSSSRSSTTDDAPSSSTSSSKVMRNFAPAGYKPQIRPRSNELEKSTDRAALGNKKEVEKLRQNHVIRSVKPPLPKKTAYDTTNTKRYSKNSSSAVVPKSEHHDWKVAPDLEKIGRDNIVIIESHKDAVNDEPRDNKQAEKMEIKNEQNRRGSTSDNHDTIGRVKPAVDKEKVSDENELPKPNTVSAFRTLFEKTNKTTDTLNVWRSHHSPTRKSSGSDTNSPQILSPNTTPRSPLVKVSNDNVFENSFKSSQADLDVKAVSPRENNDSKPVVTPVVHDTSDNIDRSSSPMQKTLERFRFASEERDSSSERRSSSSTEKTKSPTPEPTPAHSSSVQLTPLHPVSKVFDSKSLAKTDKPKRPKPTVLARKGFVPKDTIELKHEMDQKRLSSSDDRAAESVIAERNDRLANDNNVGEEDSGVFLDSNIKPAKKKESDNQSPRQTKVFDSSFIVKKNRDRPKVPVSPVASPTTVEPSSNVPNSLSVDIRDGARDSPVQEAMDVTPVKPPRKVSSSSESKNTGLTEIKPNIVRNDTNGDNKPKSRSHNVSDKMFPKPDVINAKPDKPRQKSADNKETTVTGVSSFLANRLKKSQPDQENQMKTSSSHLVNGSSPSPVPRKRQAPERPVVNGSVDVSEQPPALPATAEPALTPSPSSSKSKKSQQQNATKGKMVFDSSKIATKRKDPPKRKPPRKTLDELNENITFDSQVSVPKLDLTCITNERQESEYQEGYIPTNIKPCPFKFIGAEVTLGKSPLKKTKRVKMKIQFDDHATTTFEYEGEESALQNYLLDHPDEKDDVIKQDEEVNGVESSTDELLHDSPRSPVEPDTHMKSNTVIGHSAGALTSYKSKILTQDFQFGMSTQEPEPVYNNNNYSAPSADDDSFNLLPAADTDLDAFSAETGKSDMLF